MNLFNKIKQFQKLKQSNTCSQSEKFKELSKFCKSNSFNIQLLIFLFILGVFLTTCLFLNLNISNNKSEILNLTKTANGFLVLFASTFVFGSAHFFLGLNKSFRAKYPTLISGLKKFRVLLFCSCFIFGIFYYFSFYLSSFNSSQSALNFYLNNQAVKIQGYVKNSPVFVNDSVVFELASTRINNKILKENITILVNSKLKNVEKFPEYKKYFEIDGKIRQIDGTEKYLLTDLGFESNVFFILDDITSIKNKDELFANSNQFFCFLQKFRENIFSSFYNEKLKYIYKNEVGFFKWIFTGEASDLPIVFNTKNFRSNPIFVIINSKLYLWFILVFTFLLSGKLSLKRKIIYVASTFLILFFCSFQLFNFSVLAPALIIILFLFFASHFHSPKALFFALNFGIFGLLLCDPFLLSARWFIYFVVLSLVFVLFTKKVDKFLCDKLKGWIFWGFFCLLLLSSFFGFYRPVFPQNILLLIFVLCWIFLMLFLQKKYPMENLEYNNKFKILRQFFSFCLTLYLFGIIPLFLIYGNSIDLSALCLIFPVLLLFVFSFQVGFLGIIFYFLTSHLLPEYLNVFIKHYDIFSILSNKIITKSILFMTANFPLRYLFVFKTSYLYIPLYFCVLFVAYYFL